MGFGDGISTVMDRKAAEFWWSLPYKGNENRKPFKAPPYVHSYEKTHSGEWKERTWKEVFKKRTEKQNVKLGFKRRYASEKPCYVWVYYNEPNKNGLTLFSGWWISIVTLHQNETINFRNQREDLILEAMQLYPCGVMPIIENFEVWAKEFVKRYRNKTFYAKGRLQGLAKAKCYINDYGKIEHIL